MAKKSTKNAAKPKAPRFTRALDKNILAVVLASQSQDELFQLWSGVGAHLHWSIGDPTTETLEEIKSRIPILTQFIDFKSVINRLDKLPEFERSVFGVSLKKFFPELVAVHSACSDLINAIKNSVAKAESWIRVVGADAGADADVEAAVYLASRGEINAIDADEIRNKWHSAICFDIAQGRCVGRVPTSVVDRAKARTISLAEASQVLTFRGSLLRFFSFRDEEEEHIDQTMFRAVEWLGITGFDPWLKSYISELSIGPQNGFDHPSGAWWLFHWCRSDLALRMADRSGLESWLWALLNGPHERSAPWRIFWGHRTGSQMRDYLPLAGLIPFIWHRIQPSNIPYDVPDAALALLAQTQLPCGAWPLYSDDGEPCLMSTYAAIHGLGIAKPRGWKTSTKRAADWLITQQAPAGCWYVGGGPTVAITVQVLDAIAIGHGREQLTFSSPVELPLSDDAGVLEATYNCEIMDWHDPKVPATVSVSLEVAKEVAQVQLAILVATETELRQVLRLMRPLPTKKKLWRVPHGHETTYVGKFGSFEAVVVLCRVGTHGPSGATLTANAVIETWDPIAVLLVGIAFGASRTKHLAADVLVASQLIPYEIQRRGKKTEFRNPVPPSGDRLLNRFRNALEWKFDRPDGSRCSIHCGPILTGDKLVDDPVFKQELLDQYPSAIGGEMEGAGLWGAATRAQKEWIVVKSVCDWGDGKKHKKYQEMAAAAAASLCLHVFTDPNTLDGF